MGPEDFRAAAQIATSAANTLITIAVAAAGGALAYFQFLQGTQDVSAATAGLIFAAVAAFVLSMVLGMYAISEIYKRGEGRLGDGSNSWSTKHARGYLNGQAGIGLLGLVALSLAVWTAANTERSEWSIGVPHQDQMKTIVGKRIYVYGNWDELYVRNENDNWVRYGKVPVGERAYLEIKYR
jgi:hypothetical protein